MTCENCGCDQHKKVLEIRGDKYLSRIGVNQKTVNVAICLDCGFVFQMPKIDLLSLEELYRDKYRGNDGFSERYCRHHKEVSPRKAEYVLSNLPINRPRNVFDIGVGAGFFLKEFQKKGIEIFGLEPTFSFAEYAENILGIPVTKEMFSACLFPEKSFDMITVVQTLEHIHDLQGFIFDVRKLLSPGGGGIC